MEVTTNTTSIFSDKFSESASVRDMDNIRFWNEFKQSVNTAALRMGATQEGADTILTEIMSLMRKRAVKNYPISGPILTDNTVRLKELALQVSKITHAAMESAYPRAHGFACVDDDAPQENSYEFLHHEWSNSKLILECGCKVFGDMLLISFCDDPSSTLTLETRFFMQKLLPELINLPRIVIIGAARIIPSVNDLATFTTRAGTVPSVAGVPYTFIASDDVLLPRPILALLAGEVNDLSMRWDSLILAK